MVFMRRSKGRLIGPKTADIPEKEDRMLGREKDTGYSPDDNTYNSRDAGNDTILSNDAEFKGSLTFNKKLRIDGKFEGDISSPGTIHVGPDGDVKAEVNVGNSVVEGKVTGNITAEDKLELRSTAKVYGDIKAARLVINEGVIFVGKCEVNPSKSKIEVFRPEEKNEGASEQHDESEVFANK